MFKKWFIPAVVTAALFALPAAADNAAGKDDDETQRITEVVEVLGDIPVVKTIQSVSIFKNAEMKKFNFESLKSVLRLTPGLLTLSTGQFGQSSSTTIRGSKPTQVLYIVDGVKLRDGASIGGVSLAMISPNLLDKVEVVRGPLSSIYGSDAMGGVVSMNTVSRDGADFTASFGSHGSHLAGFSGSTKLDNLTLALSVNNQRYSNDLENDGFKNTGLSAKVNYKTGTVETGLRFFGTFADSGIPLNYGAATPNRTFGRDYYILALPFTYRFNDVSAFTATLAYTNSTYQFQDPDDMWSPYFKSKFDNYEVEAVYKTKLFEKLDLRAGVDYSDQKILNEDNYGPSLDNLKMNYFSSYVSTSLNLDALQLSASLRYDKYKDVDGNVSPQIGLAYLIADKLKLRAAYSHSFLAPMVSQMVNPWGDSNFNLKPEKGKSFEVGAEFYSQKAVLSVSYFNTRYEDMIDWVLVNMTTFAGQYQNVLSVDTSGVEMTATFYPVEGVTFSGAYTYLKTENKVTGEPLLRKPKHTLSAFASYTHRRFTLSLNMVYVGKRPDLDYSAGWGVMADNPSFNSYDASLVVRVGKGLSVFGKITNAFDKEYQELFGYPAPGRRFELGLKYRIK